MTDPTTETVAAELEWIAQPPEDIDQDFIKEQEDLAAQGHVLDLEAGETLLKRMRRTSDEMRRATQFLNDEIGEHQAAIEVLANRAMEIEKPFQNKLRYLESFQPALIECARQELERRGKGRTIKFTYGSVAFRNALPLVTITHKEVAVEWAQVNAPEILSLPIVSVRKWIADTGEAIPGVAYEPQPDNVTVTLED